MQNHTSKLCTAMFWHPPTPRFRHAQLRATLARRVWASGVYSGVLRICLSKPHLWSHIWLDLTEILQNHTSKWCTAVFWHPPNPRFRHAPLRATLSRRVLATVVYSGVLRKSWLGSSAPSAPSQRPPHLWRVPLTRTLVYIFSRVRGCGLGRMTFLNRISGTQP